MKLINWDLSMSEGKPYGYISHPTGYVVGAVTSPIPIVKPKYVNLLVPRENDINKYGQFGYINQNFNASGPSGTPVIQPVNPVIAPAPNVTSGSISSSLPATRREASATPVKVPVGVLGCTPRPACMDADPPCSPAQPVGGWCEPKEEVAKEEGESMQHYLAYAIGGIIGGAAGYFIAKRSNTNVYGGLFIGAGIVAGGVYLYFNGKTIVDKISHKDESEDA